MILEDAGYGVEMAQSGEEAWEIFQKKQFDVVVTDFRMGAMDGLQLIRMIRDSGSPARIVLLSGFAGCLGMTPESTWVQTKCSSRATRKYRNCCARREASVGAAPAARRGRGQAGAPGQTKIKRQLIAALALGCAALLAAPPAKKPVPKKPAAVSSADQAVAARWLAGLSVREKGRPTHR